MYVFHSFFLIAVSLQLAKAVTQRYLANLDFDDKKSDNELPAENNASSLSFCSALCGFTCGCFGFNAKEKKCVYYPCDRTKITVVETGWRHYFPPNGNDVIHRLTKGRNSSLYVSITLQSGKKLYELYHQFSVSDEANKYKLSLGGPVTGTLGDRMLLTGYSDDFASGMYFSTPDRDNDRAGYHCAANWRGGWWFNSCHSTYLNGLWSSENWLSPWYPTVQYGTEIKETLMMIKPH
ncbi:ficolin-1-like [Saccostrea echinata]|uniref:ficolin-1-like n=1 Tax=Saccostrea echinata TaxID=191078 RepID=UPI002A83B99B|nr:ficolin-1-like [Saccostrea echinata]